MISEAYSEFITAVASVVIQTAIRRFLAKTRVLKVRKSMAPKRKTDSLVSSNAKIVEHEGSTSQKEEDMKIKLFDLAAVRIQSMFRGWMVRDFAAVDHFAATIIQKHFRGFVARNNYSYDLFRIIVSQSMVRKYLALEAASHRLAHVTLVQSVVRGFLVRSGLGIESRKNAGNVARTVNDIAASKIQAQWRSYTCEMAYLRTYEDIVMVQTLARGWITRRLLRAWLKAHNMRPHGNRMKSTTSCRGHGGSTSGASRNCAEKIKNFNEMSKQRFQEKEIERFGARQGNSRVLMRYHASALGEDRTFHASSQQSKRKILNCSLENSEEAKSNSEIAQRAGLLEQDKRKKELVALTVRRKKEKLGQELSAVASREDEQHGKRMIDLASREEEERRKEQRRKDLAIIAARHEKWRNPDTETNQQKEAKGKSEAAIEDNARSDGGSIRLPLDDEAEQLRKERIAFHRDPDAAATLRQERISRSLSCASTEGFDVKENASLDSRKITANPDVNAPKERDIRFPVASTEVVTDINSTAAASIAKAFKFAPIRPPKRQNPFQSDRPKEEQQRIDKIHETFRRVGLMNRSDSQVVEYKAGDMDSFAEEKSEKADVYDPE